MILVINCGSSSLKYELFQMVDEKSLASGVCERVGINGGADAKLKHQSEGCACEKNAPMPDHGTALGLVIEALIEPECGVIKDLAEIKACGHRVVNGGAKITESVIVDDTVISVIEEMSAL
ncbi:MAG: acetate kinase, partial [Armatimonadota bacterium]